MTKPTLLLTFLLTISLVYSQNPPVDSLLQKLSIEKDDDKKVDLAVSLFLNGLDKDPYLAMPCCQFHKNENECERSFAF